jgi:parallel beta-helix repeat protein
VVEGGITFGQLAEYVDYNDVWVDGNQLETTGRGIFLYGSSDGASNSSFNRFHITGNTIVDSHSGIFAYGVTNDSEFSNNIIKDAWQDAIKIDSLSSTDIGNHQAAWRNVSITGNSIRTPGKYYMGVGITVKGWGYNCAVTGNTIEGIHASQPAALEGIGIYLSYSYGTHDATIKALDGVTVSGNTIRDLDPTNDSSGMGIYVLGHNTLRHKNLTITGNTVSDVAYQGIRAAYVENCAIEGNVVENFGAAAAHGTGKTRLTGEHGQSP